MADRGMSASMLAEIAKDDVLSCLLIEVYADSGTLFFTNAYMDLSWNSNTYSAAGNFISVSRITESINNEIPTMTLSLSGVASANVALALGQDLIDRQVIVRRAYLDASYAVISDPLEQFNGNISSHPSIIDNRGASTIEIRVSSHWADFERVAGRRTNNEDQQTLYSGDTFFLFTSEIIKDAPWGRT